MPITPDFDKSYALLLAIEPEKRAELQLQLLEEMLFLYVLVGEDTFDTPVHITLVQNIFGFIETLGLNRQKKLERVENFYEEFISQDMGAELMLLLHCAANISDDLFEIDERGERVYEVTDEEQRLYDRMSKEDKYRLSSLRHKRFFYPFVYSED